MSSPTDAAAADMVIRGAYGFRAWFTVYAWIRNKRGKWEDAKLNRLQERVCDAIEWCHENRKPIRLIILKPRQKGASTISVAAIYYFMCAHGIHGVVVGGQYSEVKNMWKILLRYSEKDAYRWGIRRRINQEGAVFTNGANLERETARDRNAARSGTLQGMLATEAARWHDGEAAPPKVVINGILNCMPDDPGTIGIIDSTAEGASGFYYDKWKGAVTLQERKAGRIGNGWIQIFAGWHEFEDSRRELDVAPDEFEATLDDKERALRIEYDLDLEQIYWRRHTIADNCDGDTRLFDMDFPGKPADAFTASRPGRFHSGALDILTEYALGFPEPIYANLSQPDPNNEEFVLDPVTKGDYHQFVIFETPKVGSRYNLAIDTMTGEQAEGDKPDNHAMIMGREGFWDEHGRWRPPMVAARSVTPCTWDIDLLVQAAWRLSVYYGGAQIVPEENQDRGLIRDLVKMGANVFMRTVGDEATTERDDAPKNRYGFKTKAGGENSRKMIIDNLAKCFREQFLNLDGGGILIPDLAILKECETFIVNAKGKPEAAPGAHDDLVMALAICLATMAGAHRYMPRQKASNIPPELRDIVGKNRRANRRSMQYS